MSVNMKQCILCHQFNRRGFSEGCTHLTVTPLTLIPTDTNSLYLLILRTDLIPELSFPTFFNLKSVKCFPVA